MLVGAIMLAAGCTFGGYMTGVRGVFSVCACAHSRPRAVSSTDDASPLIITVLQSFAAFNIVAGMVVIAAVAARHPHALLLALAATVYNVLAHSSHIAGGVHYTHTVRSDHHVAQRVHQ